VIAYLLLPGEFTSVAEQAYLKDPDWAAPLLWQSEFRNILVNYVRQNLVSIDVAIEIFHHALALVNGREFAVAADEVILKATRSACSAYDCEFVVLAEQLGVPLITTDKQVLTHFPGLAVSLPQFLATS
jgi:predicted nucleic acid-binding protein